MNNMELELTIQSQLKHWHYIRYIRIQLEFCFCTCFCISYHTSSHFRKLLNSVIPLRKYKKSDKCREIKKSNRENVIFFIITLKGISTIYFNYIYVNIIYCRVI
jgi:hypothetical protein